MNRDIPHKVLFVCTNLAMGGAERVMLDLLVRLDRTLFRPYLLSFKEEPGMSNLVPADVKRFNLQKKHKHDFFRLIMGLRRILTTTRPALVLSFMEYANYITLLAGRTLAEAPCIIISVHNYLSQHHRYKGKRGLRRFFIRHLYPLSTEIIAVSRGIKTDMVDNYGCPAEKISIIYNGVDIQGIRHLAAHHPQAEVFTRWKGRKIIACGRLTYQKNFSMLLRAFAALPRRGETRLFLLGEGAEKKQLQELAVSLALEGQVHFMGFADNPFCYMARSDLFVLSSRYEGFGNVLIEAMACGVAVIATDCPHGPAEIIADPAWGCLVPNRDQTALTEAMDRLLADDSLRVSLAKQGQSRAEDFISIETSKKYQTVFLNHITS